MRNEIIPNLRYADALKAIEFLCAAFGFERRAVHLSQSDARIVQHAQLTWRDRMVMVSSAQDNEYRGLAKMKTAAEALIPISGAMIR